MFKAKYTNPDTLYFSSTLLLLCYFERLFPFMWGIVQIYMMIMNKCELKKSLINAMISRDSCNANGAYQSHFVLEWMSLLKNVHTEKSWFLDRVQFRPINMKIFDIKVQTILCQKMQSLVKTLENLWIGTFNSIFSTPNKLRVLNSLISSIY